MTGIITRRSLLRGLFAMPAVVAAGSLMPIRGIVVPVLSQEAMATAYAITRKAIDDNLLGELMPGLEVVRGSYDLFPSIWAKMFEQTEFDFA